MNAIKTITTKTLVRCHKADELCGLVIAVRDWDLSETIDFINKEFRRKGIFLNENEYKYEDCLTFDNDGERCLVFPFLPHIPLDLDIMVMWRLRIRPYVLAMWIEDYIWNRIR